MGKNKTEPSNVDIGPSEAPQEAHDGPSLEDRIEAAIARVLVRDDAEDAAQGVPAGGSKKTRAREGSTSHETGESFESMVERVLAKREASKSESDWRGSVDSAIAELKEEVKRASKPMRKWFTPLGF